MLTRRVAFRRVAGAPSQAGHLTSEYKKIRALHAKEKQQIRERAATRIALTYEFGQREGIAVRIFYDKFVDAYRALIHHPRSRARELENTENEKENVLASGFRITFYSVLAGARGREAGLKISVAASLQKLPLCDRAGAGGFLAHLLQE